MTPPRIWIKPDTTLPGVGTWTAENTGSAEMAGAMEYAPVSELDRLRAIGDAMAASIEGNYFLPGIATKWRKARAVLEGDKT
jgi:hypothetical protein